MLLIQLAKEEVLAGMTGPDYQEKKIGCCYTMDYFLCYVQ